MSVSNDTAAARALPFVLVLFAAGGCAALIYEVVWYQLLQLAIGASAVSLGILLATFMGGLALGSLALRHLPRGRIHPLRLYALIELGIGICGLLILWGLPLADGWYIAGLQHGLPGMLSRSAICAACLLAPTFLMGASLPTIARFVDATPKGVAWWGWLYAGNTLGAVAGCLLAGFYLLRLHDMAFATYVAAALNLAIALGGFALAAAVPVTVPEAAPRPVPAAPRPGAASVLMAIALSGATALGAEVVWTRQLGMMFDGTVYAFSLILAVFLVGMALGSAMGTVLLKVVPPRPALGWAQLLLAGAIAWAVCIIDLVLPYKPVTMAVSGWMIAGDDLIRCLVALLPAALLWGISFPLALASAADHADPAQPVGAVYAANTLGGVAGALLVSLVLVSTIGSQNTERLMLLLAAGSGLLLLLPSLRGGAMSAGVTAAACGIAVLIWALPAQPGNLVAYGRLLPSFQSHSQLLEVVEGRNSSVAITRYDGALQISVAGHVEATNLPFDMRLQRMVGHLPALLHPGAVKVLGIGFGAGVSAGSFTGYPSVKSITICEMEPKVPPTSAKYFAPFDNNVKADPRTRIVYDDGRHYLRTTSDKFDIIASDPLDVWVKGTASIYSADYFEQVKKHLNPGGYFTLYVPLYESDEETVKSELATFFQVFPNGTVWANTIAGTGYDLVLMGQNAPLKIDIDAAEKRLGQPEYAKVAQSLREIGLNSATDLYATYAGRRADMQGWLKDAQINTDGNLRLMYLAGWGINAQLQDPLYRRIIGYRSQPLEIFTGSAQATDALYREMAAGGPPS